mmetsp:Transcript_741/g.2067  ORF Transcript_741/g.2067 Transcript_741/m.2067 type:complete len:406 (-) Transcript_741:205-1422(-)
MPAVEHQREAELIAALRARVSDLTPPKRMPFDDACLARYLRARNMQVGPAADALHATVAWRAQFGADDMRAPKFMHHLEVETATLKSIVAPFQDRKGRPVVVIDPSRENSTSKDGNIALAIYNMERAIATAPNPQSVEASSVLFIFNCKGLSPRAGPSLSTTLAEARILQAHYPERLGQALVLDAPGFIGDFWNVLRRAVDPNSREKVQFLSTKTAEGRAKLDSIIDTSLLTPWHGGTAASEPYPDSRVYLHPEVDPLAYDPTSTSSQADPQRSKLESTDGAVGAGGGFSFSFKSHPPRSPRSLRSPPEREPDSAHSPHLSPSGSASDSSAEHSGASTRQASQSSEYESHGGSGERMSGSFSHRGKTHSTASNVLRRAASSLSGGRRHDHGTSPWHRFSRRRMKT